MRVKVLKAEIDSLIFSTSSFYIFWGQLGVGKTFAARYLASSKVTETVLTKLKKREKAKPLFISAIASTAKTAGGPTFSVHKQFVKRILQIISKDQDLMKKLAKAHENMELGNLKVAFKDIGRRSYKPLDNIYSLTDIEKSDGYKLIVQERSKFGKADDIDDLVTTLRVLLRVLFTKYTRVFLMIDELEVLGRTRTAAERVLFSDYLRRLHDRCDNGLTVVMIFTFYSIDELQETIMQGLYSRVRDTIQFGLVKTQKDIKEYIIDCIKQRGEVKDISKVISETVLDKIAGELLSTSKQGLSFRDINMHMHKIFAATYLAEGHPAKYKITDSIYTKAMHLSADEILKQLEGE